MSTLATATKFEDDVLRALNTVEDAALRTLRYVGEAVEPITKLMAEPPLGGQVPAPADVVDHMFVFVDKLVTNQREFAMKLVELLPTRVDAPAPKVKSAPKARAA